MYVLLCLFLKRNIGIQFTLSIFSRGYSMKFLAVVFIIPLVSGVYRPPQAAKFQWQLQVDSHHHFDYSDPADVYDTDLWAITTHDIRTIHQ